VRRAAPAAAAAALLVSACASSPVPVPVGSSEAAPYVARWEERRAEAYGPRRLKALYRAEAAPKVGAVARGYLSVWWDGSTLVWKASAPLAGDLRAGRLSLLPGGGNLSPLPGRLAPADAIGALLGVLDLPAAGRPVERTGDLVTIRLDVDGRAAQFGADGRIVALLFPGRTRVRLESARPLPLHLDASGPGGTASLALESWADWPNGEAIPGGGA
jgi:hypothetical protein